MIGRIDVPFGVEMIAFITARSSLTADQAYQFCSLAVDFRVTQTVNGEDPAITLDVVLANVVEKPATLTDHHEQTTASVVVVLVVLEVVVEIGDPRGEDGDLHFRRSGIGIARAVRGDNCCFVEHEKGNSFVERHRMARKRR